MPKKGYKQTEDHKRKLGKLRKGKSLLKEGQWSRRYGDCCINCGTTERPHLTKGLCLKCYGKQRYYMNRERVLKILAAYRELHKEQRKQYYQNNREKERLYGKIWKKSDVGKQICKIHNQKRRAIKKSVNFWTDEMTERWFWMLDATEGYCPRCGELFDNGIHNCTMDHIIPLDLVDKFGTAKAIRLGAIHHIDNIQVLCRSCNCSKSTTLTLS